jgi:hypothetical protein
MTSPIKIDMDVDQKSCFRGNQLRRVYGLEERPRYSVIRVVRYTYRGRTISTAWRLMKRSNQLPFRGL